MIVPFFSSLASLRLGENPPSFSVCLQHRYDARLRLRAGDVDAAGGIDEDVDLAAHPEVALQVDARLDREAGPRQDAPRLVRLQVVHVRAVAVRLLADRVPGAMAEGVPVAGGLDHVARRLIDL